MLGYMTKAKAKEVGFTHEGNYYFVPLYLAWADGQLHVGAKWAPLELFMPLISGLEILVCAIFTPGNEFVFEFRVTGEL